jgi:hypothetical protein
MADRRRAEIEEKRAKLAELRRARDERKALLAQAQSGGGGDRAADVGAVIRRLSIRCSLCSLTLPCALGCTIGHKSTRRQ